METNTVIKMSIGWAVCFHFFLAHLSLSPYFNAFHVLGEAEDVEKFSRRLVKVTRQHSEECKELLKVMGVPYIDVRSSIYTHIFCSHF